MFTGCSEQTQSSPAQSRPEATLHLVELVDPRRDTLRMSSVYTGSLRARHTVRIFTQEEGAITKLPFFEGDWVTAGTTILKLDDQLLRAQLNKLIATLEEAEANLHRVRRMREQKLISEDDYFRASTVLKIAQAEETLLRTRLGYTQVQAPFDGVIVFRGAEPGDFVDRNSHVLTVADPTSLIAELNVSELILPHIDKGDAVSVRIDALGDAGFSGMVSRIHPELNPSTRQGRVEIKLDPVPEGAQAGQFARVSFRVVADDRLIIPFAALRHDRDGEYVFAVTEEQKAKRVQVRSGRRMSDKVEILEGLGGGERIVAKGFLGLLEGKQVSPAGADDNSQSQAEAE